MESINTYINLLCYQQQQLQQKIQDLKDYEKLLFQEKAIAEKLFQSLNHANELNLPGIRHFFSKKTTFNGDLLLVARTPKGGLHIILGDFTGHGLPAAIGSIPLSQAFYTMTAKGFPAQKILMEINRKLRDLLPPSIFCAALFLEVLPDNPYLKVWNGGLPSAILYDEKTGIKKLLKSRYLPLGVLDEKEFNSEFKGFTVTPGDHVYIFSDGITEAVNAQGDFFTETRVYDVLDKKPQAKDCFDKLLTAVMDFCGGDPSYDDIALLELRL